MYTRLDPLPYLHLFTATVMKVDILWSVKTVLSQKILHCWISLHFSIPESTVYKWRACSVFASGLRLKIKSKRMFSSNQEGIFGCQIVMLFPACGSQMCSAQLGYPTIPRKIMWEVWLDVEQCLTLVTDACWFLLFLSCFFRHTHPKNS